MGTEYLAVVFTVVLVGATSVPLGRYIARVFTGQRTPLDPVLRPIERLVVRAVGIDPSQEQTWQQYSRTLLISNVVMWLAAWTILTMQQYLPLNPDGIANMEPTLAFNTASSFTSNTNLQHYSGETGLSYFSQIFAITFLQFVTAATGIAACVALMRALAGNRLKTMGNFYLDLTRATVRLLLPLAVVVAIVLMWQGSPMTLEGAARATTVEGAAQVIARGVVAPMVAIKQLGTNGGGYFGPNSTHPFENPTPLSNLVETWSILVIPMAMVWALGYTVGRRRVAVVVFAVMLALYVPLVAFAVNQEAAKPAAPETAGTLRVESATYGFTLWAVIVILGLLMFMPVAVLGPVAEHLALR
jgi:K+-transporting ATPase ATPase A chain